MTGIINIEGGSFVNPDDCNNPHTVVVDENHRCTVGVDSSLRQPFYKNLVKPLGKAINGSMTCPMNDCIFHEGFANSKRFEQWLASQKRSLY